MLKRVIMAQTMRAVRVHQFGGPEVLTLDKDVPIPLITADQVLVKIKAAGVNPVETYIRSGQYAKLPDLPYVPGSDGAGVVEAVGANVTNVQPGDGVWVYSRGAGATGTYIEFITCPATSLAKLPDPVSFAQGACLGVPNLSAFKFQPGDRVWVYSRGAGATGTYAEFMTCPATSLAKLPDPVSFAQGACLGVPNLSAFKFQPGDRVWVYSRGAGATGTYAEFMTCPATSLAKLPDPVSFAQGACLGVPNLSAFKFQPGDRVWVYSRGAGATGTYAEFMTCPATSSAKLPDPVSFAQGAGLGVPNLAAFKFQPGDRVWVYSRGAGATGTYAEFMTCPATSLAKLPDPVSFAHGAGLGVPNFAAFKFQPGDRVWVYSRGAGTTGTYAEFMTCPATSLAKLPDPVSFAQGACLGVPYLTAYRALFHRGEAKAGQTVLVHGASGAVGLAACQLANARGLNVFGTASTDSGSELVAKAGASAVFNHKEGGYVDQIKAKALGGFDLILEMLANVNLANDLILLANGGKVMVIGSRGNADGVNARNLMATEGAVMGVALAKATDAELKESFVEIGKRLSEGSVTPVVGAEYKLHDAAKAHDDVIAHQGGSKGNIVLRMD